MTEYHMTEYHMTEYHMAAPSECVIYGYDEMHQYHITQYYMATPSEWAIYMMKCNDIPLPNITWPHPVNG